MTGNVVGASISTMRRFPSLVTMLVLLVVFVATLVFGPLLYPPEPNRTNIRATFHPPSAEHPLGTDGLGRDLLARVLYGGRLSLLAGLGVVLIGGLLGTTVGVVAGYFGGKLDFLLMRITDLFLGFPALILAIALAAAFGAGLTQGVLAASIVWWPGFARVVRGQVIAVKQLQFVEAAAAAGASNVRIIFKHILPACLGEITIKATLDVGLAILFVASLGFLGLGAQPPTAEWGTMVAEARPYILDYWWVGFFPGVGIAISVILFNFLGDTIQPLLRSGRGR